MADYIYTMEIRLTPDQQKGANLVQKIALEAGFNLYLTGGAVRDIISGFPIRDLDFTVQGNPLKLQKELEKAGASVAGIDEDLKTLYLQLPGNVRRDQHGAYGEVREGGEASGNWAGDDHRGPAAAGLHGECDGLVAQPGIARAADGSVQRRCRH